MPTITGRVIFDKNRNFGIDAGESGLANVPVVLQNTSTGNRLVVLTNATGDYSFINVPNASYRIVEVYGQAGGVATPGDFSTAAVGPVPVGADPPISFATSPPTGSTNLDSTTPNTLLVTVTGANLINENFLDGPIIYTPITSILDSCATILPNNLITTAGNGQFGSNPPGTAIQTAPATAPYPGVTPDFTYTQYPIIPDGSYTILNIGGNSAQSAWWNMSDHTIGDETGRFMLIGGSNPGAVFFQQTVSVTINTNYIFTSWITNVDKSIGDALPKLGVLILDQNGNTLYDASLGNLIPTSPTVPEWKQLGTVINSQNNTQLTVKFVSQGPSAQGNDYAIDDILLQPINIPVFTPVKSVSSSTANAGETVTYTVTLTNTCTSHLTNVFFQDTVPSGLSFVSGSATGGLNPVTDNPNVGFTVPDIPGGGTATITFNAHINSVPTPNPIGNIATMNYSYTPVQGGISNLYSQNSNTAPLQVNTLADISIVKTASPSPVIAGNLLTYTNVVSNAGPSAAEAVSLADTIPGVLTGVQFSTNGGTTYTPWVSPYSIGTLTSGASATILIRGTVSSSATGNIVNTAVVSSTTLDPNPANNTSTVTTPTTASADVSIVKTASPSPVIAGNLLTYTNVVSNAGPSDAEAVSLADTIPGVLTGVQFSTNGGTTYTPWVSPYSIGTLTSGASATILIRGTVSSSATGNIVNTAVVSSTTLDPNPANNTSTVTTPTTASADVSIVKTASPSPVIAGNLLTYTNVVSNAGPSDAEAVSLADTIPGVLTGVQFSTNGGTTYTPWVSPYSIGTLTSGASATILIRGTVSSSATGNIVNTAVVSSTTLDPNPANNTSTVTTPIVVSADVSIIKTASPVVAGQQATYTMNVSNAGPSDALDVDLTDVVPTCILNPEYSLDGGLTFNPWTGSINLGTITAGTTLTVLIRGTVDPSCTGTITNTATVSSPSPDPDPTNNTSTVITPINTSADISVVKTTNPSPVVAGQQAIYTMEVSNAGPSDALNVNLTDAVPACVLNPEYSLDGGLIWIVWPGSINLGTILTGGTVTVLIRGTVDPSCTGTITNTVAVSSITPDPDPTNNTSTVTTPINTSADISVVKTANPSPVIAGNLLNYTMNVSNAGPSDALNVILTDAVSACILNPEYLLDGGLNWIAWPGTINLGTIAAGATVTVLIRGIVDPSCIGTITNTVTVSSITPDPNLANNTSTVTTPINTSADISVVKTASPSPAVAGQQVIYTNLVHNSGPSDALNVDLTDAVPACILTPKYSLDGGLTFIPWTGSINLGTIAADATVTVLIRGIVDSSCTGTITNTVVVSSTSPDSDPTNNTSTVITPINTLADISVIKTANPSPVTSGTLLTYTMYVSNAGPSDALNVDLTDAVPACVLNPEYSLDGGLTFNPWPSSINLGTIVAGATVTVVIRGTVHLSCTGTITNTVAVSSQSPDPDPTNNTSTVITPINPLVDIIFYLKIYIYRG